MPQEILGKHNGPNLFAYKWSWISLLSVNPKNATKFDKKWYFRNQLCNVFGLLLVRKLSEIGNRDKKYWFGFAYLFAKMPILLKSRVPFSSRTCEPSSQEILHLAGNFQFHSKIFFNTEKLRSRIHSIFRSLNINKSRSEQERQYNNILHHSKPFVNVSGINIAHYSPRGLWSVIFATSLFSMSSLLLCSPFSVKIFCSLTGNCLFRVNQFTFIVTTLWSEYVFFPSVDARNWFSSDTFPSVSSGGFNLWPSNNDTTL